MAVAVEVEEALAARFPVLLPHLDERQRRLYLGLEARSLGHGGIEAVARAAGVSRQIVAAGAAELEAGGEPPGRARRPGGGRKQLANADRGCARRCWRWWTPARGGTRSRRCGGRPCRCGTWPPG